MTDLESLRARAERELEYAEWAGTLRASEMDGIGAEHLSTRLLAACYREKALLDRLEAAERAIDEASQLQHRAEMGWADTQAALEAAERERDSWKDDNAVAWEECHNAEDRAEAAEARLLTAQQALREADQAMMYAAALLRGIASDVAHHTDVSPEVERLERAQAALAAVGRVPAQEDKP